MSPRPHTTHLHFRVTCSVPDDSLGRLAATYRKAYDSDDDDDWQAFHDVADYVVGLYAIDIEPTNDDVLLDLVPPEPLSPEEALVALAAKETRTPIQEVIQDALGKLTEEVSGPLLAERVFPNFEPSEQP